MMAAHHGRQSRTSRFSTGQTARRSRATDSSISLTERRQAHSHITDGAVWKLNMDTGVWTDITPDRPNSKQPGIRLYVAVSSRRATSAARSLPSTFGHPISVGGEDIFRSMTQARRGRPIFDSGNATGGLFDYSFAPIYSRAHTNPLAFRYRDRSH